MTSIARRRPRRAALDQVARALASDPPDTLLVDCFGTLLHRSVPSRQVQLVAATDLAATVGAGVDPTVIATERRRVERELSSRSGQPRDFPLPELARALYGSFPMTFGGDEDAFATLFCDIEVAAEIALTEPNADLVEVLRAGPDSTRIVVVSDTNLTSPMLRTLLRAHDLEALFDEVVVSCDAGETKRSGSLYDVVLDATGAEPSRTVMVGDNAVADGDRARDKGLEAIIVAGGRWDEAKDAPEDALRHDLERRLDAVLRDGDPGPFPELSLTLWLFTARLDAALRQAGAARAVFLAREGRFLRELFDRYQDDLSHHGRPPIASSYLLTSRKATKEPSSDAVVMLDELVSAAAPEPGVVHLVDVGWKGTVQDHLSQVLDRDLAGHYLGLLASSEPIDQSARTGHLFTNLPARSEYFQVFSHFKGLYELLLAADHGSVAGYRRGGDHSVEAILDDNEDERRCFTERIGPFQQATRERFDLVAGVLAAVRGEPHWLTGLVARHHARMMYRPTREELAFVDGLVQFENFGATALRVAGQVQPEQAKGRGFRRHVAGGGWPPLRMQRAGAGWQRYPYGALKLAQLRRGRLR